MNTQNSKNDRRYFRVSTKFALEYQLLTKDQFEQQQCNFGSNLNEELLRELQQATLDSHKSLITIMAKDRDVASFLGSLNHRMDLIAQLFGLHSPQSQVNTTCYTSEVSEGGLTFLAPESIKVGSHLAINLLLRGSPTGLVLFARVRASSYGAKLHPISVQFSPLEESVAAKLSRSLMQEQSSRSDQREFID